MSYKSIEISQNIQIKTDFMDLVFRIQIIFKLFKIFKVLILKSHFVVYNLSYEKKYIKKYKTIP